MNLKTWSVPGDIRLHVREQLFELVQDLVKDGVGGLVAAQALLRQVLVRFGQAFDLQEKKAVDQKLSTTNYINVGPKTVETSVDVRVKRPEALSSAFLISWSLILMSIF